MNTNNSPDLIIACDRLTSNQIEEFEINIAENQGEDWILKDYTFADGYDLITS